ncbi:MAG TPA: amidohydrolase family protein, partial [Chloroflexota bacterium]
MPPWGVEKARQVVDSHQESFRRAHEAGVKIAMGTDAGVGPHGGNAKELALMVDNGMSPMEAIVASTARAAELLGIADRLGTIEPGKVADLILVDGNPAGDITVLLDPMHVTMVMKDGQVYKDLSRSVENTDILVASDAEATSVGAGPRTSA